jgi:hypothetical protein
MSLKYEKDSRPSSGSVETKRPYQRPKIREYGSLSSLTAALAAVLKVRDGGAFPQSTKIST